MPSFAEGDEEARWAVGIRGSFEGGKRKQRARIFLLFSSSSFSGVVVYFLAFLRLYLFFLQTQGTE